MPCCAAFRSFAYLLFGPLPNMEVLPVFYLACRVLSFLRSATRLYLYSRLVSFLCAPLVFVVCEFLDVCYCPVFRIAFRLVPRARSLAEGECGTIQVSITMSLHIVVYICMLVQCLLTVALAQAYSRGRNRAASLCYSHGSGAALRADSTPSASLPFHGF
jgi:hypothetical protein